MKKLNIVNGPPNVSAIIQGCMRMPNLSVEEALRRSLLLLNSTMLHNELRATPLFNNAPLFLMFKDAKRFLHLVFPI